MLHGDATFGEAAGQFVVQLVVAEADGRRFGAAVGKDDAADSCPIGGGEAHRAGFAGGVEGAVAQVEVAEGGTGHADGGDFGMGGGVLAADDAVPAFADDLAVVHDDGAKRAAIAFLAALAGQFDGAGEEDVIRIH